MSWLQDIVRVFIYACKEGHETDIQAPTSEFGKGLTAPSCNTCGSETEYIRFENVPAEEGGAPKHVAVETFEQNGRIGLKVGSSRISMTKHNYMKNGTINSEMTPSYKKHYEKLEGDASRREEANFRKSLKKGV